MMINLVQKTVLMASMILSTASAGLEDDTDRARELQSLVQIWNITEPTFEYDSLQFSLMWQVSDYIQDKNILYSIYAGHDCKDGGGTDITESSNYNDEYYLYTPGIQASGSTPYNSDPATSGSGLRDMHLHLSIQSDKISTSPIYRDRVNAEGEVSGNVQFCIRFCLFNDSPALADSLEVNYIESLIDFNADLSDGFEIGLISVIPKNKNDETANDACEVLAFECDEENQELEVQGVLRNQGSEVRVCVTLTEESKSIGLFLNRLTWFYFYRETLDGSGIDVKQDAILVDAVVSPTGLSELFCQPGDETCAFTTILIAPFFNRQGMVLGIGEAVCQFGGNEAWSPPTAAPTPVESLAPTAEPLFSHFECDTFSVIAGTAITFAASTITGGDVGGGAAITGIYTLLGGEVVSPIDIPQLGEDIMGALDAALEIREDAMIPASEMGSLTFTPGTWRAGFFTVVAAAVVTLDGEGDPNSVFLFQAETTMLIGAGCKIVLVNGAKAENVLWALGTTLTAGAGTVFEGSIIAGTAITFGADTVVRGYIAAGSSITFGANNVMHDSCIAALTAITFGALNSVTMARDSSGGPSCGSEVILVDESDDVPLLEGAITIDSQAEDGTSVTFTVRQKWDETDAISWMATMYPNNSDGANVCSVNTEATYDYEMQYTANCFNEMSSPIRVFVQVADAASVGNPVTVPEDCLPASQVEGAVVGYEISIPCLPCVPARALRSRNLSVHSSPTSNHDIPYAFKTVLSETCLHNAISNKSRDLQEAPPPAANQFELEFGVNKAVDGPADSAFLTTLSVHAFLALSCTLAFTVLFA